MADNLTTTTTVSTVPSGSVIATDDVSGVHFQKVKIDIGGDGASAVLGNSNPLPVSDAGVTLSVDDGAGSLTIDGTVAVSGTVNVSVSSAPATSGAVTEDLASSGGETSLLIAGVRNDAAASKTSTDGDFGNIALDAAGRVGITDLGGSVTVDNAGTFAVQATVAAGASTIAKAEDVASADADVGVPAMAVRKATPANTSSTDGDYEMLQMSAGRLWTSAIVDAALPAGANAIGKLAANDGVDIGDVTINNASGGSAVNIQDGGNSITVDGTVAVSGTVAISEAAGATTPAKAEDAASANADVGIPAMAVQKATPANTAGTDGDYEMLQMSAGRLWASATIDAALPAGTNAIGKLAANSGVDIGDVDITSVVPGTGATNLGKAEDAAHTSGDVGVMALSVRQDTAAALAGTDADYQPLITDASGRLHVNVGNTVTVGSHAVTNAGTFAVQESGSALTALQLIDDPVVADDAAFTPATTKVMMAGFEADETSTDSVDEGDGGAARMTLDRKVIVNPQPHTAGGLSVGNFNTGDTFTALTNSAQVVKGSAGQVYGYYIYNPNSSVAYVMIYNVAAASVTVGTTTALMILAIPATAAANLSGTHGLTFDTAISIAAATTGGGNTAPSTALEAMIFYK